MDQLRIAVQTAAREGELIDLRAAVVEGQGEYLYFCVRAGFVDCLSGKALHGEGKSAHVLLIWESGTDSCLL